MVMMIVMRRRRMTMSLTQNLEGIEMNKVLIVMLQRPVFITALRHNIVGFITFFIVILVVMIMMLMMLAIVLSGWCW